MNRKPKVSKENLQTAKRLLKYVTGTYKVRFVIVFICILLSSIASISVSLSLKFLIDDFISPLIGQKDPNFAELYRALAVLGSIFLMGVIATFTYTRLMVYIGQGVLKKVRDDMFEMCIRDRTADISLATEEILTEVDCLTNLTDNTVVNSLATILDKANEKKIPVFGSEIEQVKLGCLAAEGLDYVALGKQTGKMAADILKGEKKASEMNYETISEPGLYINTKVAEDLGVTVDETLLESVAETFDSISK